MTGEPGLPGDRIENQSVTQSPMAWPVPVAGAAPEGTVVPVIGLEMVNCCKFKVIFVGKSFKELIFTLSS